MDTTDKSITNPQSNSLDNGFNQFAQLTKKLFSIPNSKVQDTGNSEPLKQKPTKPSAVSNSKSSQQYRYK